MWCAQLQFIILTHLPLIKGKKKKKILLSAKPDSLPGVQQANNGTLETDINYLFQSCQAWVPGGTPQIQPSELSTIYTF